MRKESVERIAQALGVVPALLIRRTERKANGRECEDGRVDGVTRLRDGRREVRVNG